MAQTTLEHVTLNSHNIATTATTATAAASAADKVRIIETSEYKEAAKALAEAFADDHVARYFVDTPDRAHWTEAEKWDLHVSILEYITYAHILNGWVTTIGDNYDCIALWMPPGKNMDDLWTILRSGLWRLYYQLSAEGRQRFFNEFFPLLHDTKAAVLGPRDNETYYLVYIGTRPSGRGKGYARKSIEHVTKIADRENRACYLESSNVANPAIYRKLGFAEVQRIKMTRSAEHVELDIMVREPGAKAILTDVTLPKALPVVEKSSASKPAEKVQGEKTSRIRLHVSSTRTGSSGMEKSVVSPIAVKAYAKVR